MFALQPSSSCFLVLSIAICISRPTGHHAECDLNRIFMKRRMFVAKNGKRRVVDLHEIVGIR